MLNVGIVVFDIVGVVLWVGDVIEWMMFDLIVGILISGVVDKFLYLLWIN